MESLKEKCDSLLEEEKNIAPKNIFEIANAVPSKKEKSTFNITFVHHNFRNIKSSKKKKKRKKKIWMKMTKK